MLWAICAMRAAGRIERAAPLPNPVNTVNPIQPFVDRIYRIHRIHRICLTIARSAIEQFSSPGRTAADIGLRRALFLRALSPFLAARYRIDYGERAKSGCAVDES